MLNPEKLPKGYASAQAALAELYAKHKDFEGMDLVLLLGGDISEEGYQVSLRSAATAAATCRLLSHALGELILSSNIPVSDILNQLHKELGLFLLQESKHK